YSSVHGQLGGFDEASLRCADPLGALPPDCVAGADGKTRYVVDIFAPNVNSGSPYAPLELYLMGLLPAQEVPDHVLLLDAARMLTDTFDEAAGTVQVEASGLTELSFADIVARHGMKPALPEAERAMRAAFVVVSSAPASDAVMEQVGRWSATFGA